MMEFPFTPDFPLRIEVVVFPAPPQNFFSFVQADSLVVGPRENCYIFPSFLVPFDFFVPRLRAVQQLTQDLTQSRVG